MKLISTDQIVTIHQDLSGKVLDTFSFLNTDMHDVAITPDSKRMLCVSSCTFTPKEEGNSSRTEELFFGPSLCLVNLRGSLMQVFVLNSLQSRKQADRTVSCLWQFVHYLYCIDSALARSRLSVTQGT